jgi:hypothetical protein
MLTLSLCAAAGLLLLVSVCRDRSRKIRVPLKGIGRDRAG